jgi:hypothetical protein
MPELDAHVEDAEVESNSGDPLPERRRAERHPGGQDVTCRQPANVYTTLMQIKDVSTSGFGLLGSRRFEGGNVLILELEKAVPHPISVYVRVVRVAAHSDGRWLLGCALFSELTDEELGAFQAQKAMPKPDDRQVGVRIPQGVIAVCRRASFGVLGQWVVEVKDLSGEGIGLLFPCEVDHELRLRVDLPAGGGQPSRTLIAQVVRSELQPDGRWLIGCKICPK